MLSWPAVVTIDDSPDEVIETFKQAHKQGVEGDVMTLKMGRKPAVYTRDSLVRSHIMAQSLGALGAPPTHSPNWTSAVSRQSQTGWHMYGNDTYGDCVIADCAHQMMLRTANVGDISAPTPTQVLALYAFFQGMKIDPNASNPNLSQIEAYLGQNDNGCDEVTVIQWLTKTGWLGHKLDSYANLDPTQLNLLKWAVCIFGSCRLGLNLPESAESQFNARETWTPVPGAQLAGGHDVPLVYYDSAGAGVLTWGRYQPVSWSFLTAKFSDGTPYLEEAHAELSFDWVNTAGLSPSNLNLKQLLADLQQI